MVAVNKIKIYQQFAERLHRACDQAGLPKGRGRASKLGRLIHVSYKGAGKWLTGEGMPDIGHGVALALLFHASFEWLYTGRSDTRKHAGESETGNARIGSMYFPASSYKRLSRVVELWAYLTDDAQDSITQHVEQIASAARHGNRTPAVKLKTKQKRPKTSARALHLPQTPAD